MLAHRRILKVLSIALLVCVSVFCVAAAVHAGQPDFGQNNLPQDLPLPKADLYSTVVRFINIFLGFLGLIFFLLILYAGVIWMTSGGASARIDTAKKIMINATIGLVIIIMAWAITFFVFRLLTRAAGGSGPGGDVCSPGLCGSGARACFRCNTNGSAWGGIDVSCNPGLCENLTDPTRFQLQSVSTANGGSPQDVYLCSNAEGIFNNYIRTDTVTGNAGLEILENGTPFPGTWSVGGNVLHFSQGRKFTAFTNYEARFPKTLYDTGDLPLSLCGAQGCSDQGAYFSWPFKTGDTDDVQAPSISFAYPPVPETPGTEDRNVSPYSALEVVFDEGISALGILSGPDLPESAPECQTFPKDSRCFAHPIAGVIDLVDLGNDRTGNTPVDPDSLSIEADSVGFRITPITGSFDSFHWYRMTVQNITDLCGNSLQAPVTWEWQTNDASPGIGGFYPSGDAVCTDSKMSFTFGTTMYDSSVTLVLKAGNTTIGSITKLPKETEIINTIGTLRVQDVETPIDNHYRVFEFTPVSLSSNTAYTVEIFTDLVIDTVGTLLSDRWTFTTATPETCVCEPFIQTISPGHGPMGQCVTVSGFCFTGSESFPGEPKSLTFINQTNVSVPAVVEGFGTSYITSSIPSGLGAGDTAYPNFTVDFNGVQDAIQTKNTSVAFTVDPGSATGPCLLSLEPSSGAIGDPVDAAGKNFGTSGQLVFSNAKNALLADPNDWTDTLVHASVPTGALDGNVVVRNTAGESNPIFFDVANGIGGQCSDLPNSCSSNGTLCATDLVCSQSCICEPAIGPDVPYVIDHTPSAGCASACTNAEIQATFSHDINPSTLTAASFEVFQCGGVQQDDCSILGTKVPGGNSIYIPGERKAILVLGTDFAPNSWYRVVLHDTVIGANGVALGALNYDFDASAGDDSFSWFFGTGDRLCELVGIHVEPENAEATVLGERISYRASALGNADACGEQAINPNSFLWKWTSSVQSVATMLQNGGDVCVDGSECAAGVCDTGGMCAAAPPENTATITGEGKSVIRATASGAAADVSDEALLNVIFAGCQTTSDCDACVGSICNVDTNTCTPSITSALPSPAMPGDYVTISGCYFGTTPGTVFFDREAALFPNAALCGNTWTDQQIIVEIPPAASTNPQPLIVQTAQTLEDRVDFAVGGGANHPGICAINPSFGREKDGVSVLGKGYGSVQSASQGDWVLFSSNRPSDPLLTVWGESMIETQVPGAQTNPVIPGAQTGPVVVLNDTIWSNPYQFTVLPGGIGTTCGIQEAGICVQNVTCSKGLVCDSGTCTCQVPPPLTIIKHGPIGTDMCRNVQSYVVFDQLIDPGTVTADSIKLIRIVNSVPVLEPATLNLRTVAKDEATPCLNFEGCSVVDISGQNALLANTSYSLIVSQEVKSMYGAGLLNDQTFSNIFTTGTEVCDLEAVHIAPSSFTFTQTSQTNSFFAQPVTANNVAIIPIPGVYNWSYAWSTDGTPSFSIPANQIGASVVATAVQNGIGNLKLSAEVIADTVHSPSESDLSRKFSSDAVVQVFICDNPWIYQEPTQHAEVKYCRGSHGSTLLPEFRLPPVSIPPKCGDAICSLNESCPADCPAGRDRLLKDYLFLRADGTKDAIGLRIFSNFEHLAPSEWYRKNITLNPGNPSSREVDGYEAMEEGRTIYVNASNLLGNTAYTNTYLLSYNDGADANTQEIVEEVFKNFRFNTDILDLIVKDGLVDDTRRISDLFTINRYTSTFKSQHGNRCPELQSGTFISGFTMSKWTSWGGKFASLLGVSSLPTDPDNIFVNCPAGYDPESCWNGQGYACPAGSHVYEYSHSLTNTQECTLSANFERKGILWNGGGVISDFFSGTGNDCHSAVLLLGK